MVLQSEFITGLIVPDVAAKNLTVKWGEDSSVSYTDNAITTTNFTDSVASTSNATNTDTVIFTTEQLPSEGGTSDYDAILIEDSSGNAIQKHLFTSYTKNATTQVRITSRVQFFPKQ